jgi:hypothetical protein
MAHLGGRAVAVVMLHRSSFYMCNFSWL